MTIHFQPVTVLTCSGSGGGLVVTGPFSESVVKASSDRANLWGLSSMDGAEDDCVEGAAGAVVDDIVKSQLSRYARMKGANKLGKIKGDEDIETWEYENLISLYR